jgi:hypothetical protein
MLLMLLAGVGALAIFLSSLNRAAVHLERDKVTSAALEKAKAALLGYAATYRDSHANEVFGYLPCPDLNNDGMADSCGAKNVSSIGRLPWKTLGLPPLRDGNGECLWYAVSGHYKNSPKTETLNWDTPGQFTIQDAAGAALSGAAVAAILAPHGILAAQDRTAVGSTLCGGNSNAAAYLDGTDPLYAGTAPAAHAISMLTLATVNSAMNGVNNDRGLWLTGNDIFDKVKRRSDFATDVTNLLIDIRDQASKDAACVPLSSVKNPAASPLLDEPGVLLKTVGFAPDIAQGCIPVDTERRIRVFNNWRNNVLYAACTGGSACLTVNGNANCAAVAVFSGEKTTGKQRPASKAADYLEGDNLKAFSGSAVVLTGAGPYQYKSSSLDVALCIPPAPFACSANASILLGKVSGHANNCKSGSTVLQSCSDASSQLAPCTCASAAHDFITPPCINNLNAPACQSAISQLQACSS